MDLTGARIAVTGAGGFVGGAVVRRLVADGADVVGLDLDAARARVTSAGVPFIACDTTDRRAVASGLSGCAAVVHTAALVSDRGPMRDFVRVNVEGTRNVLDAADATGARVLHISSVAVWGYAFRADIAEDAEPRPCGVPYIDTKGASDILARSRGATVVRPGDVYGPGSIPWTIRPLEAMQARRFQLPGRGDGLLTLVYIDDLVDCVVRALADDEAAGLAFTAWDGAPVTAAEFFGHYARMLGNDGVPTLPRRVLEVALIAQAAIAGITRRPPAASRTALTFVSRRAVYPNALARERLGWDPQVTLPEGMRRTEEWLRKTGRLPVTAA